MRIHGLHIDGFGRFADWRRGPFERPVTLFHGANEAGKSTLLEFIRRLLFGFPDGRSSSNPYPPLWGGEHGGRLTLVGGAGEAVTVQRFQGAGGGPLMLTGANGGEVPDSVLLRLLGNHSKTVFQNVFTFTLDELHDEALLKDDQVNSQIYSAGMGAANLPKAFKTLQEQKNKIFLKGGRNHKIYEVAGKLDSIDADLAEVNKNSESYGSLSRKLKSIESKLQELEDRREKNNSLTDRKIRLENAWPDWNVLYEVERDLRLIPAIENFPANGAGRLESLEDRMRVAKNERDSAAAEASDVKIQAEAQIANEAVLDRTEEIRKLERSLASFDNDVRDLPERQAELERQTSDLMATLRELGPDWDEVRLEGFDLSLAVQEQISRYAQSLQETDKQMEQSQTEHVQAERLLEEVVAARRKAQQELDNAPMPNLKQDEVGQRRTTLRQMQSWLAEIKSIQARISDLQAQLAGIESSATPSQGQRGSLVLSIAGLIVGLALFAGGAAVDDPARFMGMVAGISLIGMAAYVFITRRPSINQDAESPLAASIRESLHRAEANLARLHSDFEREAEPFRLDVNDERSLMDAMQDLDEAEAQLRNRAALAVTLDQAKQLAREREGRERQSAQAVKQSRENLQAAQNEWRNWLNARGLQGNFSPATVEVLRGKVELGKNQMRTLQGSRQSTASMQQRIEAYVAAVDLLAADFDQAIDHRNLQAVATAVGQLVELRTEVDDKVTNRNIAKEALRNSVRRLQERKKLLQEVEGERQVLLQSGGVNDAEAFRQRAEQHRLRLELEQKKRETLGRLQLLSGPGRPLEDMMGMLAGTNLQSIQDSRAQLEEERDEIQTNLLELSSAKGSTQTTLDQLVGEEESSQLRTERHRLVEAMRSHAQAWAVRTVAENLLKKAQVKFERERQPDVLRAAQDFFCKITGGRYETVFSPLGQPEIRITDSNGDVKQPNQLSRGTREQLFLSLRFGLIRHLGRHTEPQPVILDDALVNFDPCRGRMAAEAFLDLAETNQVLVFTCHPQIVEWFTKAAESKGVEPPEIINLE